MSTVIPVPEDAAFWRVTVPDLGGRTYEIVGEYVQREGRWYLTLNDAAGDPITVNRKAVADWDLLRLCTDIRRPQGALFALDTSGEGLPPGPTDWNKRVLLIYTPLSELPGA